MTVLRRRGATTIEYALLLMLICLGCIIAVGLLGSSVSGLFSGVIPVAAAAVDDDSPTAAVADADDGTTTPSVGGKSKKAKKQHHRGQPGNGNAGNDKAVGNAPAKSG